MTDIEEDSSREIIFSREQGFFDRNLFVRFLLLILFAICLFIFLHFRDVRVEVLELNSISKHYVISQIDFSFPDEEATIIAKQRAIRNIDKLYKFSNKEVITVKQKFENVLLDKPMWRKYAPYTSLEDMNKGGDLLENTLIAARFTSAETYSRLERLQYPTDNLYQYVPTEVAEPINLPKELWEEIQKNAFSNSGLNHKAQDFIINFFEQNMWDLEEDIESEHYIRHLIQDHVPLKYTKIKTGQTIINQGEKVSSRHIAMIQAMKDSLSRNRSLWNPLSFVGNLLMAVLFIGIGWIYFHLNHKSLLQSNRRISLLLSIIILTLALAKLTEAFLTMQGNPLIQEVSFPLFVPFAAILLCSLMNHRIAIFTCGFLAIVMSMTLAVDRIEFLVINLVAAIIVIMSSRSLRNRRDVFWVMGKAWISCIIVIFAFQLSSNTFFPKALIASIVSSFVFLLITAILVVGLLPLLESIFHVLTDIILMEYMNPHNELLRRLAIEAPGTYQHSVVVGSLAEAAANEIGANGLFCRVAALYHDIGKLSNPQYFTENQQRGIDMHQLLTPIESARVIIAHVSDGVSMARKAALPEPIIDIIKEHHGTTLVYFFYHKQLELMGGDKSAVDIKEFCYPGPKPRTKESAILMIADSLEAASRSLDVLDEESITELLDKIVKLKAKEGQFSDCMLTFKELQIVQQVLLQSMVTATHSRIKYPKQATQVSEESEKPS